MRKLYFYNYLSRILFLLITPTLFRVLNFAFIWHSIYWGAITLVVLIWGSFILISPIFGRIGCGWVCFMGTIQDFVSEKSLIKYKRTKPIKWLRILFLISFLASSLTFYFINLKSGIHTGLRFDPFLLSLDLYKEIWLYDVIGAILLGLLLEKRWVCKNTCPVGTLCAAGSKYSRLIPVVDNGKCNLCKRCEDVCLSKVPIMEYVTNNKGLVTDSECILCGKCVDICKHDAIKIKFVWNRKKYKQIIL